MLGAAYVITDYLGYGISHLFAATFILCLSVDFLCFSLAKIWRVSLWWKARHEAANG